MRDGKCIDELAEALGFKSQVSRFNFQVLGLKSQVNGQAQSRRVACPADEEFSVRTIGLLRLKRTRKECSVWKAGLPPQIEGHSTFRTEHPH